MRELIFGGMTQNHNLMTRPHQNMNKYLPGEESTLQSVDSLQISFAMKERNMDGKVQSG